ncbi:C-GCAxxG-C-C family protein [Thermodesulfatator autotrophicus]|uniref:Chain A iron centre cytochrome C protein n=1 Tax=Thermodesulfatator autotrophicus TaxID=1795632 RepID=A0A177E8L1_9BACT|nr:C-GCAxxG-C-C family protein [Thermodesulfatator autotrophicus]OAG28128.1 chain A iron centre cytochrome C protein [Thermodesulfatator autotrophicus]
MSKKKLTALGATRRDLLKGTGALLLGLTAGKLLLPESSAQAKAITEKWPWPYEKLDPVETAELAYRGWYKLFCGGSVVCSIFSQLRKKVGGPYNLIPIEAFIFAEGGVAGWGTICGSLLGANVVTNFILGPRIAGTHLGALMGSEIMEWYCEAAMPVYVPKNPKVDPKKIPHTVSDSPLCHISVGKWMKKANKSLKSPERRDRCARVTASVAYHLVVLLNKWKDGKYEPDAEFPSGEYGIPAQHNCEACHGDDVPEAPES